MSKKTPDYTKFMRSPGPLKMSSTSDAEDRPTGKPASRGREPAIDDNIPWGEIILEPDQQEQPGTVSADPLGTPVHRGNADFREPTTQPDRPTPRRRAGPVPHVPVAPPAPRGIRSETIGQAYPAPAVRTPEDRFDFAEPPPLALMAAAVLILLVFM